MQSWTLILIIVLAALGWFTWYAHRTLLLNKTVWANQINPSKLRSVGDIKINEDIIQIKYLWRIKTFSFDKIDRIKAYAQTDWGLEEHEHVEIIFNTAAKITFNASVEAHREIIQQIAQKLGIADTVWAWDFLPHLGDKLGRDIVFEKTKSR